jgi:hypothetical protein
MSTFWCFEIVSLAHLSVQEHPRQIHFEVEQGILQFIEQNETPYATKTESSISSLPNIISVCTPSHGLPSVAKITTNP